MNLTIICGSHRNQSQSQKVSEYIKNTIDQLPGGHTTNLISLAGNPYPLWDEGVWAGEEKWKEVWQPTAEILKASDGFVFVVPEWAGMVPPGFKNFLLLCGNNDLGHKPVLAVGVSGSRNGAYPIAELRMTSGKNNHLVYVPDHLIVRDVNNVLNGPEPEGEEETYLRKRILYSVTMLSEYSSALKTLRSSQTIDFKSYPFGM